MPFWSTESRAQRVIDNVAAYQGFEPVVIPLDDWRSRWLPDLQKEGFDIGLNWSGSRATGFDVSPQDVERNLISRESSQPNRPEDPDIDMPEGSPASPD